MTKSSLVTVAKALVSLLILGYLFWQIDLPHLWQQMDRLSLPFILFALGFYAGCQLLSCFRWQIILQAHGVHHPLGDLFRCYFGGMFLNSFLPSSIGGDAYRVYRLSQSQGKPEIAFASVFLERVTGLIALLTIAFVALIPAVQKFGQLDILLLLVGCTLTLWTGVALILNPWLLRPTYSLFRRLKLSRLWRKLFKIQRLLIRFARSKQQLITSMLLSLLLQLLLVYYYFLVAQQLNISLTYGDLLVFIPIITVFSMLPISIGGYGVKEGIVSYLFVRVGLTIEQALLFSIALTFLGLLLSLPGAVVVLQRSPPKTSF